MLDKNEIKKNLDIINQYVHKGIITRDNLERLEVSMACFRLREYEKYIKLNKKSGKLKIRG